MKRTISVFCGSSEGNDAYIVSQAYQLGVEFAKHDITLVYGAAKIGIMGQVAKGIMDNEGKTIGVIPEFLKMKEVYHPSLTELIITKNMHERKVIMYEKSEAFIILPGGFGTMDEFFEIATWGQLGLHTKPIGILNLNGFYNDLLAMAKTMVDKGFLKQANLNAVLVDTSISGLLNKVNNYKPLSVPKWLKKEQI